MRCDEGRLVQPVHGDVTGERLVAASDRVPCPPGGPPLVKAGRRRVEVAVDVLVRDVRTSLLPDPSGEVGAPLFVEIGVATIVSPRNPIGAVLIAVSRGRVGHITELALRNGNNPFAQRGQGRHLRDPYRLAVKMQDGVIRRARREITAHCEAGQDQKREQAARPTPGQALAVRSLWEGSRRHALSSTRELYRCKSLKIVQGLVHPACTRLSYKTGGRGAGASSVRPRPARLARRSRGGNQ